MPKVSVIVPVYDVEKYLCRCIDSILGLTFTDYELILVDDASPDRCPEICDAYAQKDVRVHVIHRKKNTGSAAARNAGLDFASGKYILFCDSDDQYNTEKLSGYLADVMIDKEKDSTLFCFNFLNVWSTGKEEKLHYPKTFISIPTIEDRILFLSSQISHASAGYSVWNKLYSKKIIDEHHIRFLERDLLKNKDDWAEDLGFNLQYYMCVNAVRVDESPIYLLTKHGDMQNQTETGLTDRIEHMLRIFSHLQDTSVYSSDETIEFWQIAIWHLRRYIYLYAGTHGVEKLRITCQSSDYALLLDGWIAAAVFNRKKMKDRWNKIDSKDYSNLLAYLKTGNLTYFKLKSHLLWRFYPFIKALLGCELA